MSYDSFRGRGKEVLKAYQENSNLAEFAKVLGKPDSPIEKADETALFQIINQLIAESLTTPDTEYSVE